MMIQQTNILMQSKFSLPNLKRGIKKNPQHTTRCRLQQQKNLNMYSTRFHCNLQSNVYSLMYWHYLSIRIFFLFYSVFTAISLPLCFLLLLILVFCLYFTIITNKVNNKANKEQQQKNDINTYLVVY